MKDLLKVIIKEEVAKAMLEEGKFRDWLKKHSKALALGAALGIGAHAGAEEVSDRVSQHIADEHESTIRSLTTLEDLKEFAIEQVEDDLDESSREFASVHVLKEDDSPEALNNAFSTLSAMRNPPDSVKIFVRACLNYMTKHGALR
jgi:hypothetical protein